MVRLPEYFRLYAEDPMFTCRDEIGLLSPPPINSIVKAIPDHDQPAPEWFPWNRDLGYHDATDHVLKDSDKIIREDLGEPACLTEYLWMGDLYSSLVYRAIYEAANKVRPRNAGTHIWKINAAWPSVVQQVFDWYSASQRRLLRHALGLPTVARPVQRRRPHASSRQHAGRGEAEPEGARHAGRCVRPRRTDAGVRGHGGGRRHDARRTVAGRWPRTVGCTSLGSICSTRTVANWISVSTWVQADCRFHELMQLPPATIDARVIERTRAGRRNGLQGSGAEHVQRAGRPGMAGSASRRAGRRGVALLLERQRLDASARRTTRTDRAIPHQVCLAPRRRT